MKQFPFRNRMTLAAILLLALLLPLAPLPACMEAFAYMDTERSVKLDAPFLPTPNYVIAEILSKAGVGKDDILYDLGSGDGRIVIEAAKQTGCRAVGVEIDADLVDDSRFNAVRAGVQDRVRFVVADLFKEDFSEATVVTLYMGQDVNLRLRPKLLRELKPGTRIASYSFDMGEWKPDQTTSFGREDAYFWVVPANASGKWAWTEGKGRSSVRWEMELKQVFQEFSGQISRNGRPYRPARREAQRQRNTIHSRRGRGRQDITRRVHGPHPGQHNRGRHDQRRVTTALEGHPQPRHDAKDRPLTLRRRELGIGSRGNAKIPLSSPFHKGG